jgi:hypothetical protein
MKSIIPNEQARFPQGKLKTESSWFNAIIMPEQFKKNKKKQQ